MSYEGYTELLCDDGHYSAHDVYAVEIPIVCRCGKPFAYTHGVDQTNGYERGCKATYPAGKVKIGADDIWCEDHHGNRYAIERARYRPRKGSDWRALAKARGEPS